MAYPGNFLRLVAIGTLYDSETFSWSLSCVPNFGSGVAPETVPQGVIDAVTAFHTSTDVSTGTNARLTAIKLNEIGPNGRYVSAADTVLHEFETPIPGAGTSTMPPQLALAVTLRTAARRGRASSGRFYVPRLGTSNGGDGRLTANQALSVATAATTLLNDLNAAVDPWRVGVASDIADGQFRPVTHVEVGRVVDTIRSRRSSLDEDRQAGAPLEP